MSGFWLQMISITLFKTDHKKKEMDFWEKHCEDKNSGNDDMTGVFLFFFLGGVQFWLTKAYNGSRRNI